MSIQTFVEAFEQSGRPSNTLRVRAVGGPTNVTIHRNGTFYDTDPNIVVAVAVDSVLFLRLDMVHSFDADGPIQVDKIDTPGFSESHKLVLATDAYQSVTLAPDVVAATGPNR